MTIRFGTSARTGQSRFALHARRPAVERLEERQLLSTADGNGPVVIGLAEKVVDGTAAVVISFDGPLDAKLAENTAEYAVNRYNPSQPEIVTQNGPAIAVRSASYDDSTHQVTLTLARPLAAGVFYRVYINGSANTGLRGANGTLFDGDNDDTPGGDFYGLLGQGRSLCFSDSVGDMVTLGVRKGGTVQVWRELNGDIDEVGVVGAVAGQSILGGSVRPAKGSSGLVYIPKLVGTTGVINRLTNPPFVSTPLSPTPSPTPVVATAQNLPYTLSITPVNLPSLPNIQSAVYAQENGLWLIFGGRTNGLHSFNPTGLSNFPPDSQNNNIYVIDPSDGYTYTLPWSESGVPQSMIPSLSSSNQEFYQKGDTIYTIGGYSFDPNTNVFKTYDTLSAVNVSSLISDVISQGDFTPSVKQISDPRLQVTGGEMNTIGKRSYLVFGQAFDGAYSFPTTATQIYSDEVRSFRIVNNAHGLGIAGYQAQRDPVNFRRRDYNLAPAIQPNGKPGLTAFGGVFTPAGNGYRYPVNIGPNGAAKVDSHYQQYFTQYSAAKVPLFNKADRSMDTIFFGGISLYNYDFATGTLSQDTELPFVNDVTTFQRRANGSDQEYIMPSQLPGLLGTEAMFFLSPSVKTYPNGVVKLNQLKGPTTLGYIYGGIYSSLPNTTNEMTQTTASNLMFKVTLTPG